MVAATLKLDEILAKTTDLPTLPKAALQVMRETERSESSAASVAALIGQDQAITARVLRLANSAYFGLSRQVSDLQESVVILGMRNVRNLAIVASTFPWLARPLKGYKLGPKQMWTHSFCVGVAARELATRTRMADPDVAFTAGLLHNIGKVALSIWLENKVEAMMNLATRDNMTFDQMERKVLGFSHADVGAHLADRWNLPKVFVDAIGYHHSPNEAPQPNPVTDYVHVGDYVTMSVGLGLGADGLRYEFFPEAMARVGIDEDAVDGVLDSFLEAHEAYEKLFEGFTV